MSSVDIKTVITIEFPRMKNDGTRANSIAELKQEIQEMFQREVAEPLAQEGATTIIDIEITEVK